MAEIVLHAAGARLWAPEGLAVSTPEKKFATALVRELKTFGLMAELSTVKLRAGSSLLPAFPP
jgi:hypothetical protein